MLKPAPLLRMEGAATFAAALVLYHHSSGRWLWFALLFLLPDLSMLGYLAGKKTGAMAYNLAHTYTAPLLALALLWSSGLIALHWLILIWFAHIGFDRMVGYGLKYETAFMDTHLHRL